MRGINKVILIGNLGKDPDVQHIEGDIPVAKFPLATTEMRKEKNGNVVSETEWHTIVLWRGLAELARKYLHKGSLVYIEGRLHTRSWEDKDKNKRFQTEIIAENLVMLDKRKDGEQNGYKSGSVDEYLSGAEDSSSDEVLPF
ncbi:MAG TPA: single-stranded DNA-binding protein [Edaphocola sp.]|nr:single-stranded DNA-binding protein [Edaphocola sp.]